MGRKFTCFGLDVNRAARAPLARGMSNSLSARVLFLFGLVVVASGCLRYFGQEGGEKGLWFGLVMGGVALLGAALLRRGLRRTGLGLGGVALAFVAGWFTYEALIDKGWALSETRQLVVLALCVPTAVALAWPRRGAAGDGSALPESVARPLS